MDSSYLLETAPTPFQSVHEKYPIPGIKQTYRREPGRRTVLIPVLMGATILSIIAFYLWSEPAVEFDPASIPEIVVEDVPETGIHGMSDLSEFPIAKEEFPSAANPVAATEP